MITLEELRQRVKTMQQLAESLGKVDWVHCEPNRSNFQVLGDNLFLQLVPMYYDTGYQVINILEYVKDNKVGNAPLKVTCIYAPLKVTCIYNDHGTLVYYNPNDTLELEAFYGLVQKSTH